MKTNFSDVNDLVTVKSSKQICMKGLSLESVNNFINADLYIGNLSIVIEESNIIAREELISVGLYDTQTLSLQVVSSFLTNTGHGQVINIFDTGSIQTFTLVNILIEQSILFSKSAQAISLSGCGFHINAQIQQSNLSSMHSDILYIRSLSTGGSIDQCMFFHGRKAIFFNFCYLQTKGDVTRKHINISNNTFDMSSYDTLIDYGFSISDRTHTFTIHNNLFKQRYFGSGQVFSFVSYGLSTHYANLTIDIYNNVFVGFENALSFLCTPEYVNICGNTFYNNSAVLSFRYWFCNFAHINFINNIVSYNNASGILSLIDLVNGNQEEDINFVITGNAFHNNTGTVLKTSTQLVVLKHNFFENPDALYNVQVIPGSHDSAPLNASLNYWGEVNAKEIARHIFDATYDDNLFNVVFRPYLGSRDLSDIQDEKDKFISLSGEIGGTLSEDVVLVQAKSPYLVTLSIQIEEQATLTLEPGVVLRFKESQGMTVFGK